jgi:hypothetical protein
MDLAPSRRQLRKINPSSSSSSYKSSPQASGSPNGQQDRESKRMRLVHKFTDYITAHDIQGCFKEIIFEVLMSRQAFEEGRVDVFAYIAGRLRDIDSKRKQEQIEQIALEAEMKKLQLRKKAKKRAAGKHSGRNNSAPNSSRQGALEIWPSCKPDSQT